MAMKLLRGLTDRELDEYVAKCRELNLAPKYMKSPVEELARRQKEKSSKKSF